ncbi:hypothetical protein M513_13262 [Trichuris suis]|uniref:Uncharacterized protein n=1 Tax=Trichuris suis TaxID=68888 RepID=A0A085LLK3_9BILA|nr:hypothetical protein M513_13262 [Trichuris suis]
MDLDAVPIQRTLGLSWNSVTDDFVAHFKIPPEGKTKRQLLRAIASIFDLQDSGKPNGNYCGL